MTAGGVLLDTCAVIWLADGAPMAPAALAAIQRAGEGPGIHVSPVSAWEIGLLSRPRGQRAPMVFTPDPKTWFARLMSAPGIKEAPLTPGIAVDASWLPGDLHGDPGDRLIIATARDQGLTVITRDRLILAYGAAGHVGVLGC
ncbi:type II toxin-antitoxin system VapC family toxin [Falsiroseomonas sp.]|jgi:PIN domain nuclease of toxin-antitoxin system|uniref:type II toxin-antitoxin system VapC family toxin n=1 Tax=Falsiroseomonas sp. TaxID=2870721 RepID=UPI003F70D2F9